jgi:hypothetical protein
MKPEPKLEKKPIQLTQQQKEELNYNLITINVCRDSAMLFSQVYSFFQISKYNHIYLALKEILSNSEGIELFDFRELLLLIVSDCDICLNSITVATGKHGIGLSNVINEVKADVVLILREFDNREYVTSLERSIGLSKIRRLHLLKSKYSVGSHFVQN